MGDPIPKIVATTNMIRNVVTSISNLILSQAQTPSNLDSFIVVKIYRDPEFHRAFLAQKVWNDV
jgi:hypothetical protein